MAKKTSQNYSYANNEQNELINISVAEHGEKYYCPICGGIMIPHLGNIRKKHFVHKNRENCSYESYLHKLAKIKIQEAFLSSEHFYLSYKAKAVCSLECPFKDSPKCTGEKPVTFDLLKYYDTCEIEANYNQYRADLLLKSSVHPNLDPILIEILVTHKCTEEKIHSGSRIIEIPIQSEEQIDKIVNNCRLNAVRHNYIDNDLLEEINEGTAITLYNFNKKESFDPTDSIKENEDYFSRNNTIVLCLDKYGKFNTYNYHCFELSSKLHSDVHYYISTIATPWKEIFQGFYKRGVKIRNCYLCKYSKKDWHDERICVLYKKHHLPRKPSPYSAANCPHYKEDIESQQNIEQVSKTSIIDESKYEFDSHEHNKSYFHICKEIL